VRFPKKITLRDVTLRDGLQNEATFVPTEDKIRLLNDLVAAGFQTLEVTSFVRADRIPPLRDASTFAALLPELDGVEYRALVPNDKGLDRMLDSPIQTAVVFLSASTAHNQENVQRTTTESLDIVKGVTKRAIASGRKVVGAIATSFVCPFIGIVPFEDVKQIAEQLVDVGVSELSIADTIGQATPRMVYERSQALKALFPDTPISLHLHDPHGYGLANVLAGIQGGIDEFDVSQAGLGGCPYAPGAPGNLKASLVTQFLHDQDIQTGLKLDALRSLDGSFRQVVTA
jgi:hydroxymethylglutaryl-CoA lyase